jgi:hypothetical protein
MTRTLLLKSLGLLSATTLLFGCPEPEPDGPATTDMSGGMTTDMGGGGSDMNGGGSGDMSGITPDMGGGDTDMGDVISPPTTLEETIEQERAAVSEAICELVFTCEPSQLSDLIDLRFLFASKEECVTHFVLEASGEEFYAERRLLLDTGRASFDVAQAQSCVSGWRDALSQVDMICQDLSALTTLDTACDAYLQGTVAQGDPCVLDGECAGDEDVYCTLSGDDTCSGVCDSYGPSCAQECEGDTYCDEDKSECVAYAAQGEDCIGARCASDLYCDFDIADPVCAPLNALGEACELFTCQEGLYCDEDSSVCATQKQEGEACTDFGQCSDDTFCDENVCSSGGGFDFTFTVAQAGEPCLDMGDDAIAVCAEGLYCTDITYDEGADVEQGTCSATPKMVGEDCYYEYECGPGLDCDGETEKCIAPGALPDGMACKDDSQCASFYCDDVNDMCASSLSCMLP